MNSKKCLKCGHVAQFSEQPPMSCPQCGAIYSKVEQALGSPLLHSKPMPQRAVANLDPLHHSYAEAMREESLYPTFRALTKVAYFFMVVIAALVLVAGVFAFFKLGVGYLVGSTVGAIFIYILARVSRELSLMLADLSDATVRMAAHQAAQD